MIYNPEKTLFLKMSEEKGAKTANGLGMLIYQGIIAYELFTGIKLPDTIYDDILSDVFGK
jgi:shikimate dehydrogenase